MWPFDTDGAGHTIAADAAMPQICRLVGRLMRPAKIGGVALSSPPASTVLLSRCAAGSAVTALLWPTSCAEMCARHNPLTIDPCRDEKIDAIFTKFDTDSDGATYTKFSIGAMLVLILNLVPVGTKSSDGAAPGNTWHSGPT